MQSSESRCFQLKRGQFLPSLQHLLRHLDCKLLVVWDGSRTHRSHLIRDFVRKQKGSLGLEFLPAYAPELNPVEYFWSHWKRHELPNFCPQTFWQMSHYARRAFSRMRRRTMLVTGFWAQADLFRRPYIMRGSIIN